MSVFALGLYAQVADLSCYFNQGDAWCLEMMMRDHAAIWCLVKLGETASCHSCNMEAGELTMCVAPRIEITDRPSGGLMPFVDALLLD